jgi:hypothetical protein
MAAGEEARITETPAASAAAEPRAQETTTHHHGDALIYPGLDGHGAKATTEAAADEAL